ncbi:uncharacterized protein LOC126381347 [Pectinophora gossypiella]|uniref:uncharacterized protein LOC126381347 n=1 Tax=Pectinophora gossypiella TaxID=13191 RepID=UPI00214E8306|nr:uncharacterized protein LOC126381347 [Pectinophora gossypiella]
MPGEIHRNSPALDEIFLETRPHEQSPQQADHDTEPSGIPCGPDDRPDAPAGRRPCPGSMVDWRWDTILDNWTPEEASLLMNSWRDGSSNTENSETEFAAIDVSAQSRKRKRNMSKWKQNAAKIAKNTGKAYTSCSKTKREMPARRVKPACPQKCRLKCAEKINEQQRTEIHQRFWTQGNINIQRSYIRSCMVPVTAKYRYTNAEKPRGCNSAFYFTVDNNKLRVCKTFFINTLDITDRMIRTVKDKTDEHGFVEDDRRGKHRNHKTTSSDLIQDMIDHINSIPRIESHYLRMQTSREYIDGSRTIADIYRDFQKKNKQNRISRDNKHFSPYLDKARNAQ